MNFNYNFSFLRKRSMKLFYLIYKKKYNIKKEARLVSFLLCRTFLFSLVMSKSHEKKIIEASFFFQSQNPREHFFSALENGFKMNKSILLTCKSMKSTCRVHTTQRLPICHF